jgi:hypothetical protein
LDAAQEVAGHVICRRSVSCWLLDKDLQAQAGKSLRACRAARLLWVRAPCPWHRRCLYAWARQWRNEVRFRMTTTNVQGTGGARPSQYRPRTVLDRCCVAHAAGTPATASAAIVAGQTPQGARQSPSGPWDLPMVGPGSPSGQRVAHPRVTAAPIGPLWVHSHFTSAPPEGRRLRVGPRRGGPLRRGWVTDCGMSRSSRCDRSGVPSRACRKEFGHVELSQSPCRRRVPSRWPLVLMSLGSWRRCW